MPLRCTDRSNKRCVFTFLHSSQASHLTLVLLMRNDNFRVSDLSLQWDDDCSDLFHSFSIELRSSDSYYMNMRLLKVIAGKFSSCGRVLSNIKTNWVSTDGYLSWILMLSETCDV
ncbi:hypothetical protein TNIN_52381 [Trichonephila inaurata madagascariensis]|uniref:Uncharacterized protein n=1 Tax=Trichonephila inaurata madagascariensis TaxID=2747483 RepID=A0A8X6IHH0_9ARAC|nr:hypothetical protein TNIN_52381 [Trichonephila inaurata madagascariensis]